MYSCWAWVLALITAWVTNLAWHILGGEPSVPVNGLAYAGIGIVAMALVSRCAPVWHPAFKRITALLGCATLSGVDIGISGFRGEPGQKMFFASLLGIALVVLASKHVPKSLRQRWLGEQTGV